jgi:hypothetical protein
VCIIDEDHDLHRAFRPGLEGRSSGLPLLLIEELNCEQLLANLTVAWHEMLIAFEAKAIHNLAEENFLMVDDLMDCDSLIKPVEAVIGAIRTHGLDKA